MLRTLTCSRRAQRGTKVGSGAAVVVAALADWAPARSRFPIVLGLLLFVPASMVLVRYGFSVEDGWEVAGLAFAGALMVAFTVLARLSRLASEDVGEPRELLVHWSSASSPRAATLRGVVRHASMTLESRDVAGGVSRASGGDGSAASLPPFSAARGACGAPPMASARGAAPARIAGRMQLVVVHEEEHELGGSGESRARRRRRPAHRAAGVGAVRAARGGRGGEAALVATASAVPTSTLLVTGAALQVAPNILSIAHRDRLLGGALHAPLSRVDWATLLRRTFDVDVTRCTGCARRMTSRAVVTAPVSIDRLLAALRRSRDAPVAA